MGTIHNLQNKEAIEKMKELVKEINICMFCSVGEEQFLDARPMATLKVDDDGDLWFFSSAESTKNTELNKDEHVQLIYSKPSSSRFLTIYGKAFVSKDKNKIEELWTDLARAWFKNGKDDPALSVIRVTPAKVHYWDTQHGKMISLFKIAASVIGDKTMDDGVEGDLKIENDGGIL
ncbi:pyridoxamine 5'-phosphate oxidase family protein [Ferruginibacter albus]|uniref:pyridoxamine 5'-phosphate oxidase family protein n=1 Tax=Ferruginibacter albus TaxID=2875540 RepID=UPI001CC3E39A|nr:pyridoxamine 5'-phosphate oxidase family protein [Ferruginibacter albus]UAY53329.1 pyridoxamine 5'-phosphate oxidase family protein [Ferruginibacter albus]